MARLRRPTPSGALKDCAHQLELGTGALAKKNWCSSGKGLGSAGQLSST